MNERFLVIGATGQTGSRVVDGLRAAGAEVRAASRNAPTTFDWEDRATWTPALADVTAIYLVPPSGVADLAGTIVSLLEQALAQTTRRIVLHSASIIPEGGPGVGQVHAWLRDHVREWAVIRPSWFAQNLLPGHYLGDGIASEGVIATAVGAGRIPFVDVADIAAVATRALLAPELHGEDLVVTGPEALSYDDVAAVLSSASGRNIVHRRASTDEVVERMIAGGIASDFAPALAAMESALATGIEDRTTTVVAQWTGRRPRSLQEFACAHVDQLSGEAPGDRVPLAYREHLRAVTTGDTEALRRSWEPDGTLEFPYAAAIGTPTRLEGIDAIVDYFSGLGIFGPFRFGTPWIGRVAGREQYVLEIHGSSQLLADGRPYEQDYIVRFGLSERGRLTFMREFWDPTRAT